MKKPLPIRLIVIGTGVLVTLVMLWWNLRSSSLSVLAVRGLAAKVAAGDAAASAALKALGPDAVPGLVELLKCRDSLLRRQASALSPRLPKRLARALFASVGPLDASRVRANAAKALASLGPEAEAAVPALRKALYDAEPYVAMEAATALAKIGKASVPALISALAETNSVVRRAAAYALGEIGPDAKAGVPGLINTLQDKDSQVRSSTANSLLLIGCPTISALSNIIDHADASAREAAVSEFLRFYRSLRNIVPPLIKMTRAESAASRRQALAALGGIRASDDASINAFIGALTDPATEVRLASLEALILVPGRAQAAIAGLRKCLEDPSAAVREHAARVLAAIGPPARPALEDLQHCFQDNEGAVRAAAHEAAQKIEPADRSDLGRGEP